MQFINYYPTGDFVPWIQADWIKVEIEQSSTWLTQVYSIHHHHSILIWG